jgi:hypothetical protein
MDVRMNHLEFTTESKRTSDSIMRFWSKVRSCAQPAEIPRTYLTAFLEQHLIIFAERHTEDDRCHILETVDPLLTFTSLTANIEHTVGQISRRIGKDFTTRLTVCLVGPSGSVSRRYQSFWFSLAGRQPLWECNLAKQFWRLHRRNYSTVSGLSR